MCSPLWWKRGRPDCAAVAPEERVHVIRRVCGFLSYWLCAVRFDSRTNLRGGGGVCNELWLWFITVSPSDEFMSGMYVCGNMKGERNVHERRGRTISLHRFGCLSDSVSSSTISPLFSPLTILSFFVANTTTLGDCVRSLQWFRLPGPAGVRFR